MLRKQKILLITFLYNPVCVDPQTLLDAIDSLTESALFQYVDACVEEGSLVWVRQETANLLPIRPEENRKLAGDLPADAPSADAPSAPEWVALTFIPLPEAALVRRNEEVTEDVPFL